MPVLFLRTMLLAMTLPVLLLSCSEAADESQDTSEPRGVAVAAYEVKSRDLTRVVNRTGTVEARHSIRIASQMAGNILEVHFEEGDRVTADQVLARLDTREHQAQLTRARAVLSRAQTDYDRVNELLERGAISRSEYDEVAADRDVASAEVELWETRVDFGTIRASQDAVITARHVEAGDAVSTNEILFEMADDSVLRVRLAVSDRDVGGITTGSELPLRMDALPDTTVTATVRRVFPAADPGSRLVPVELELTGIPDGVTVRPGYLARATLDIDSRDDVLAVPGEALLGSEGDEYWVYIINTENRLQRRHVTPGVARRNWTEILDGLEPGEIIVGTNPTNFQDNMLVRVTQWIDGQPADAPEIARSE